MTESRIEIGEESPARVPHECRAILNATRSQAADESRFDWLYRRNPDGEATVWIARDDGHSGKSIGFVAALPRRILIDGETRTCWNAADASVLAEYRGRGVATRLRTATRVGVDEGRVDFFYGHPNERMAGAHVRAGNVAVGRMVRYTRVVRIAPYLADRLPVPRIGQAAGRWADSLRHRWSIRRHVQDGRYTCHMGPACFDERFDELFWREAQDGPRVVGIRDARYLNWRYAENPLYATRQVVAELDGRLAGYLLFVESEGAAHVKDVFPMHRPDVVGNLIHEVLQVGYQAEWKSVHLVALESNPLLTVLSKLGFFRRKETSQMFAYCPGDRPWARVVLDKQNWGLTVGDRDV